MAWLGTRGGERNQEMGSRPHGWLGGKEYIISLQETSARLQAVEIFTSGVVFSQTLNSGCGMQWNGIERRGP